MNSCIPLPVLFHPLKHHLGYIRSFINSHASGETCTELIPALRTIGNSQMDLYLGDLCPASIALEIVDKLKEEKVYSLEAYRSFLEEGKGFQVLHLSDGTGWVLRWGEVKGRYVHIHPARYASRTIRVKAAALKTAIAAVIRAKQLQVNRPDLTLINEVRQQWLGLSPSQAEAFEAGIAKLIGLLL